MAATEALSDARKLRRFMAGESLPMTLLPEWRRGRCRFAFGSDGLFYQSVSPGFTLHSGTGLGRC
jgi:hypothetical protein